MTKTTRNLTVLLLTLGLGACSSSSKKDNAEGETGAAEAPWDGDAAPAQTATPGKKGEAPKARPVYSSNHDFAGDLDAAIKAQDDERIRMAAHNLLRQRRDDPKALNALALSAYKAGKFDLAIYLLGKAIDKSPNVSDLHSNLAMIFLAKGDKGAAVKSLRHALDLNANDGPTAANLGALYLQAKDYQKAKSALAVAVGQNVRDPRTLNNYGIALAATGDTAKARQMYDAVLKDNADNREAMLNEAILFIDQLNEPQKGLDLLDRLKAAGAPAESRERLVSLENKAKAGLK